MECKKSSLDSSADASEYIDTLTTAIDNLGRLQTLPKASLSVSAIEQQLAGEAFKELFLHALKQNAPGFLETLLRWIDGTESFAHVWPEFKKASEAVARRIDGRTSEEVRDFYYAEAVPEAAQRYEAILLEMAKDALRKIPQLQIAEVLQGKELGQDYIKYLHRPQTDFEYFLKFVEIPQATQAVLEKYHYKKIIAKVAVEDTVFFLTEMHETHPNEGGYKECLFFSVHENKLYPRLAYKSKSGSAWRITITASGWGDYVKGPCYTQGTKPFLELDQMLYAAESVHKDQLPRHPRIGFESTSEIDTYYHEVAMQPLPVGLHKAATFFERGFLRQMNLDREMFNALPEAAIPDFSREPIKIVHRQETFADRGRLELYAEDYEGQRFYFWMKYDEKGRVSIERIYRHPRKITSYGTHAEVFEWAVCGKPFNYSHHVTALDVETIPLDRASSAQLNSEGGFEEPFCIIAPQGYVDVTPVLDQFNIIKRFREQRGIRRKKGIPAGDPAIHLSVRLLQPLSPAESILKREQFRPTPEIKKLIHLLNGKRQNEIRNYFQALLKNPGSHPSITLRGLYLLWAECFEPGEEEPLRECLEIILEKFTHGFPPEKDLYTSLYRDILMHWTKSNVPRPHRGGETYYIGPNQREIDPMNSENPDVVRYAIRLKLLETTVWRSE